MTPVPRSLVVGSCSIQCKQKHMSHLLAKTAGLCAWAATVFRGRAEPQSAYRGADCLLSQFVQHSVGHPKPVAHLMQQVVVLRVAAHNKYQG
jgi:hypothetical protein